MLRANQLIGINGPVMNHIVILDDNGYLYLKSYDSIVAKIDTKKAHSLTLGPDWDYSRTTMKHLCEFLKYQSDGQEWNAAKIRKELKAGNISYDGTLDV